MKTDTLPLIKVGSGSLRPLWYSLAVTHLRYGRFVRSQPQRVCSNFAGTAKLGHQRNLQAKGSGRTNGRRRRDGSKGLATREPCRRGATFSQSLFLGTLSLTSIPFTVHPGLTSQSSFSQTPFGILPLCPHRALSPLAANCRSFAWEMCEEIVRRFGIGRRFGQPRS